MGFTGVSDGQLASAARRDSVPWDFGKDGTTFATPKKTHTRSGENKKHLFFLFCFLFLQFACCFFCCLSFSFASNLPKRKTHTLPNLEYDQLTCFFQARPMFFDATQAASAETWQWHLGILKGYHGLP